MQSLQDLLLREFRQQFGEESIKGVSLTMWGREGSVYVRVRERSPDIVAFAEQVEKDFLDDEMNISVFVVRPRREILKSVFGRMLRRLFGPRS